MPNICVPCIDFYIFGELPDKSSSSPHPTGEMMALQLGAPAAALLEDWNLVSCICLGGLQLPITPVPDDPVF